VSACPLTKRQLELALLMMDGLMRKQAAAQLGMKYSTACTLLSRAYRRAGVGGKGQLFALIAQEGWGPPVIVDYMPAADARHRANAAWRPTAAQRLYLDAFDRLLARRDVASAAAMDLAFRLMCWERGVHVRRIAFDAADVSDRVDAMLLGIARGVTRPIPDGLAAA